MILTWFASLFAALRFAIRVKLFAWRLPMWIAYAFSLVLAFRAWRFQGRSREAILVVVCTGSLLAEKSMYTFFSELLSNDPYFALMTPLSRMLHGTTTVTMLLAAIGNRRDTPNWRLHRTKFGLRAAMLIVVYFALATAFARVLIGEDAIVSYFIQFFRRVETPAIWIVAGVVAAALYPKHPTTSRLLIAASVCSLAALALSPLIRSWQSRSAGDWFEWSRTLSWWRFQDPAADGVRLAVCSRLRGTVAFWFRSTARPSVNSWLSDVT